MGVLWKAAVSVAGLGAVASFVLWSLYRQWLTLPIFQQLTKKQLFVLFLVFFFLTFLFGVSGLATYAYTASVAAKAELPFVPQMTVAQKRGLHRSLDRVEQAFAGQEWDLLMELFDPEDIASQAEIGVGQQQFILEAFGLRSTRVKLPDVGGDFGQLNSINDFDLVGTDATRPGDVVVVFTIKTTDGKDRSGEFTMKQHQDGVWRIVSGRG